MQNGSSGGSSTTTKLVGTSIDQKLHQECQREEGVGSQIRSFYTPRDQHIREEPFSPPFPLRSQSQPLWRYSERRSARAPTPTALSLLPSDLSGWNSLLLFFSLSLVSLSFYHDTVASAPVTPPDFPAAVFIFYFIVPGRPGGQLTPFLLHPLSLVSSSSCR